MSDLIDFFAQHVASRQPPCQPEFKPVANPATAPNLISRALLRSITRPAARPGLTVDRRLCTAWRIVDEIDHWFRAVGFGAASGGFRRQQLVHRRETPVMVGGVIDIERYASFRVQLLTTASAPIRVAHRFTTPSVFTALGASAATSSPVASGPGRSRSHDRRSRSRR